METPGQTLEQKLSLLPDQPGIYIWKNSKGEVIYVGKASSLKNRVRSYMTGGTKDIKTEHLVKNIADLDYIITSSANEALVLEANLIKRHKPKYNVMLKDDKRYPFVRISVQEPFPRVMVTRELLKDGAKYFGPFTDATSLRITLRNMEWMFPLRTCKRNIPAQGIKYSKACINHQLGKCPAPCIGAISKEDYALVVQNLLDFFHGRYEEVMNGIRDEMLRLSEAMRYEEAAARRDKIIAIEKIQKRQTVFYTDSRNLDIVGYYREENVAVCLIMKMKNGAVINSETYPMANVEHSEDALVLASFLKLRFADQDELPQEILLPFEPAEYALMNEWLKGRLVLPQRGEKSKLLALAKRNAFRVVEDQKLAHMRRANRTIFPVQELKEKLVLPKLPRRIVCMDISTIMGTDTVSSAVFFENGKAKKKNYRRFIIRSIDTQNDFAALQETMQRFLGLIDKDSDIRPDLFIIDGGKGQLHACAQILEASAYRDIAIVSLAKRAEEIFVPDSSESVILPRSSSALRLVTSIRDEAHRFAITFHRNRRSSRTLISELEEIPGIGEQTRFLLLKELGSVDKVRDASLEQLAAIKGIGDKTAAQIVEFFHPGADDPDKA